MMIRILLLLVLCISVRTAWAQSKNIQIEQLTKKTDSLQLLLNSEREVYTKLAVASDRLTDSLNRSILTQQQEILKLENEKKQLKSDLETTKKNLQISESNLSIQNSAYDLAVIQLKSKSDSMSVLEKRIAALQMRTDSLINLNSSLKSSVATDKVVCNERKFKEPGESEETFETTCSFRNYKFISLNSPDYAGRYEQTTKVYLKVGNQYKEIDNYELFNDMRDQLLALVNGAAAKTFLEVTSNADNEAEGCFEGEDFQPFYDFNMLDITLNPKGMEISYRFGLPDYCRALDGDIFSLPLSEAIKFIR